MFDQRRAPVHTIKDMRMSKLGDVAAHIGLYPRKKKCDPQNQEGANKFQAVTSKWNVPKQRGLHTIYLYLSIYLSVCLFVYCLFIYLSIYIHLYNSIYLCIEVVNPSPKPRQPESFR